MLKKIMKGVLAATLSSCVLLVVAFVVWGLKRGSGVSFQDTLFWVGALPIAVFTMGSIGRFAGRGDVSCQMSRSVSDATPDQQAGVLIDELKFYGKSSLNWILAGLLLWLGSYLISSLA